MEARWVCTDVDCTEDAYVSYKQLATKGPPICPQCRRHMGISKYELRKVSKREKFVERFDVLYVRMLNKLMDIIPRQYGCLGRRRNKHSFITEPDCSDCVECEEAREIIKEAEEMFIGLKNHEDGSIIGN